MSKSRGIINAQRQEIESEVSFLMRLDQNLDESFDGSQERNVSMTLEFNIGQILIDWDFVGFINFEVIVAGVLSVSVIQEYLDN